MNADKRTAICRRVIYGVFIAVFLAVTLLGLVQTLFFPDEINYYEKRYAAQIEPFSTEGFLSGSFQDSVESALADQITGSNVFKQLYNEATFYGIRWTADPILRSAPFQNRYITQDHVLLFNNSHLVYAPYMLEYCRTELDGRIDDLTQCINALPEIDFRLYYIEKDTDLNLETGKSIGVREYLFDRLPLPAGQTAYYAIRSFEEFSRDFYVTDHHWNHIGSYRGYQEVMALLGTDDELLTPLGTRTVTEGFSGSKAIYSAAAWQEPMTAYQFAFPDMEIRIDGDIAANYGCQSDPSAWSTVRSYSDYYGGDNAEVIFDTHRPEREDLLIIGESYDNAILKLIASHFDQTYAIDLRYYAPIIGEPFVLADYLAAHGIERVLLIGNIDYFTMQDFWIGA